MGQTIREKLKWQLILFLARRLPDCKTITPVLGESIDRELSFREKVVTRLHLFTCEACKKYLDQVRFLHEALHDHREMLDASVDSSPAKLSKDAKERMKKALSSTFGLAF